MMQFVDVVVSMCDAGAGEAGVIVGNGVRNVGGGDMVAEVVSVGDVVADYDPPSLDCGVESLAGDVVGCGGVLVAGDDGDVVGGANVVVRM